jgi:alkylation response protein AidB-like acyl-CoA dehydrogenase
VLLEDVGAGLAATPKRRQAAARGSHRPLTPVLKVRASPTSASAQHGEGAAGARAATAISRNGGLEQFVRDARIAMIYEGANGIQALDLVGRKLPKDGGRAVTRRSSPRSAAS